MKNFRFISLFLSLIIAASAVSCGSQGGETNTTTAPQNSDQTTTATEDTSIHDDLPARDFKGETITFLVREELGYEFDAEQTGDVVDDAVFKRNQTMTDRFNVNLEYIQTPGLWGSKSEYQGLITSTVMAGDDTYDIVTGQSNIVLPLAVQGIYHDLANAEYIDFEKPYWKAGYHDNAMINGHLYSLMGDYARSTLTESNVMFFNSVLFEDYKVDTPYELVKSGKWTLDAFIKTASEFSHDLDGDGTLGDHDMYGLITDTNGYNPFQYSTGCSLTKREADGTQVIDFPNEKEIDVFDKIFDFCNSDVFRDNATMPAEYTMEQAFSGGTTAFISGTLSIVEKLRDMKSDFGIVPYPKYDEEQENYITSILRRVTVASIPTTVAEPEKCTFILEAMASDGYNNIIPAYYEVALKGKYARDDDTAEMLDIISTTSFFAFADVFYAELGANSDMLSNYVKSGSQGLASFFESKKSNIEQLLETLYEDYSK